MFHTASLMVTQRIGKNQHNVMLGLITDTETGDLAFGQLEVIARKADLQMYEYCGAIMPDRQWTVVWPTFTDAVVPEEDDDYEDDWYVVDDDRYGEWCPECQEYH